jgi:hypothetical protein
MLYLLLLGQGLSVPGGVELVSEPWPASVSAFLAPLALATSRFHLTLVP